MMRLSVEAPAKINLTLSVGQRRADGYHELETVMHSLPLCDTVTVGTSGDCGIKLRCSDETIDGRKNLAYRAAELYMREIPFVCGVEIDIAKRIPLSAGLAGGSADAAAVLRLLEKLSGGKCGENRLYRAAAALGADVPFCLYALDSAPGKAAALCRGIGEKMTPCVSLPSCAVLVALRGEKPSTASAYARLDALPGGSKGRRDGSITLAQALAEGDLYKTGSLLHNDFSAISEQYSETVKRMISLGAVGASLSGSGPAVFGIFSSPDAARKASSALDGEGYKNFICEVGN